MPPSNILRLRASRTSLLSSKNSVSAATTSSTKPTHHLPRCYYCFQVIPIEATRRFHVAATPECKAAEDAAVKTRLKHLKARELEGRPISLYAATRDCVPVHPEPVKPTESAEPTGPAELTTPTAPTMSTAPTAPTASATPTEPTMPYEPAAKRRRVTVEELHDEEAPVIRSPSPAASPIPSAASISVAPVEDHTTGLTDESGHDTRVNPDPDTDTDPGPSRPANRRWRSEALRRKRLRRYKGLYVEDFPDPLAGAPISEDRAPVLDMAAYMRARGKMANPKVFEVCELLMTSGLTDSAKERHLRSSMYVDGHAEWKSCAAMLTDLDKLLPHGSEFMLREVEVFDGNRTRVEYLVMRDVIEVIRELCANPEFNEVFRYAPEIHWLSPSRNERVYSDMSTAKWWWDEQEKLRKAGKRDATIASLIVASDQTTLSIMCGGQTAYPVYLTLGNISKDWRRKPSKRAMVLLGYLPVDSFEDVFDDNERRRLKADLVHRSMEMLLAPIKQASEEGVEMWCPDGRLRRIFPRIAAYLADWPEQCLMACTKQSSCPICTTKRQGRGDLTQTAPPRDRDEMLAAWRSYFENEDIRELEDLSLTPVWPWWKDLPDVNLSSCITPDMLHQLYQGLFKTHLVRWLRYLVGTDTLDERFASMPGAEGMIRFPKGISAVKQWTGRESKEMASQILPMVVGELTPEVSKMVRSIVDFIFRAHASSMTDSDLVDLENDLQTFHQLKDLLVAKGFYQSDARFDKIPKLHMLSHYADSIRALGTPDGYNTEAPEHLHIEYAKVPWRASNKVRPLKQMLTYIQRQEAIRIHRAHLDRYLGNDLYPEDERTVNVEGMDDTDGGYVDCVELDEDVGEEEVEHDAETGPEPVTYPNPRRRVAVNPTKPKVEIKEVIRTYGASDLTSAITNFLTRRLGVSKHDILLSPYNQLQLWHRLYLYHDPLPFAPFDPPRRDVIRASAPVLDERGRVRKEGVWDVALFLERPNQTQSWRSNEEKHGIMRYRAGRVRTFFTLPGHLRHHYPGQLAYVEVFSAFDASVSPFARMHCTQPDFDSRNRRRTLVIPVTEIALACHLAPKFHLLDPELRLTPQTDLFAISKNFWFNHYYNHYLFKLVQHWWRRRPGIFARLATLPGV